MCISMHLFECTRPTNLYIIIGLFECVLCITDALCYVVYIYVCRPTKSSVHILTVLLLQMSNILTWSLPSRMIYNTNIQTISIMSCTKPWFYPCRIFTSNSNLLFFDNISSKYIFKYVFYMFTDEQYFVAGPVLVCRQWQSWGLTRGYPPTPH